MVAVRHERSVRARVTAEPSFREELRAWLRQAPWYATSAFVHGAALLALHLFFAVPRTEGISPGLAATVDLRPPRLDEDAIEVPDPEALRPEPIAEPPLPDEDEEIDPGEPPPVPELAPPGIGAEGATRIPKLELSTPLRGGVDDAHGRAAEGVARGLGNGLGALRGIAADRIVVRRGEFDHIEKVLALYDVPCRVVDDEGFRRLALRPDGVVFLNCDRRPAFFDPEPLRAFVRAGGWLMTTDWALRPYLTECFPELVEESDVRMTGRHRVVPVEAAAPGNPLLAGVFRPRHRTLVWLEDETIFFRLVARSGATLLLRSPAIPTRAVAFVAPVGKGRVCHMLTHFWQEDGNLEGLQATHRLILNFLLARLAR